MAKYRVISCGSQKKISLRGGQDRKTVKDMLEAEEKQQDLLPTITNDGKLNLFGDRTKAAFLDAILEASTGF